MIHATIQKIIIKKQPCVFISPHFDDAVLSSGALMRYLSKKTNITVLNVFTKASKQPYTLSAKAFLKQCGYTDAETLFIDREKEDRLVLRNVADRVLDLGFTDALFRKKPVGFVSFLPELLHVYPTYRWHVSTGHIAKQDAILLIELKKQLKKSVPEDAVVFCPYAIGNHVDHRLTRLACEESFTNLIYWSDFPYNERIVEKISLPSFIFEVGLKAKHELVKGYKTQYTAMFHDSFPLVPEKFFYRK
jgi:hypothetical protein